MPTESNRYLAEKIRGEMIEAAEYLETLAGIDEGENVDTGRLQYLAARLRGDTGAAAAAMADPDPLERIPDTVTFDVQTVATYVVSDRTVTQEPAAEFSNGRLVAIQLWCEGELAETYVPGEEPVSDEDWPMIRRAADLAGIDLETAGVARG